MKMKIGLILILVVLFSCTRTEKKSDISILSESIKDTSTIEGDFSSSIVYSSSDNNNLLMESNDYLDIITRLMTKENQIYDKEFGGGDCEGRVKIFAENSDTLFLEKTDCGDYGFGNTLFLKNCDSLIFVRYYKYDWDIKDKKMVFNISEKIYNFENQTLFERRKVVEPWIEYSLNDIPFSTSTFSRTEKNNEFSKEIIELKTFEILEN
jgi:hypothetical protein